MEDKLRANEVNLFGQRDHAIVAMTYVGLGLVLGGVIHRWFAGADWISLVGLLMLFAGAIWRFALWRRGRKAA